MVFDVNTFLSVAGWLQIAIALMLIFGLSTRLNAFIFALMGLLLIIPGFIILKDVPHFAYAFALTGASFLVLAIEGGGKLSLDEFRSKNN